MQGFVDACHRAPSFFQLKELLPTIVEQPAIHAKFLNTLSRLEYVGVRKMLKVRHVDSLDLTGLQHILEEAVHAVRLKKFAHSLGCGNVDSFGEECTLAGAAAERYFQSVDQSVATLLAESGALSKCELKDQREAAYLLTSAAIEVRAHCLYPLYQQVLRAHNSKVSVASILNDEQEHLAEMAERLPGALPEWRAQLAEVLRAEEPAFAQLVQTWQRAVDDAERLL